MKVSTPLPPRPTLPPGFTRARALPTWHLAVASPPPSSRPAAPRYVFRHSLSISQIIHPSIHRSIHPAGGDRLRLPRESFPLSCFVSHDSTRSRRRRLNFHSKPEPSRFHQVPPLPLDTRPPPPVISSNWYVNTLVRLPLFYFTPLYAAHGGYLLSFQRRGRKGPLAKIAFGATANEGREPLIGLPPHWKSSGRLCLRRRYLLGVGVGDGTVCTGSWESESWFGRSAGRSAVDPSIRCFLRFSLCRTTRRRPSVASPSIDRGWLCSDRPRVSPAHRPLEA